MPKRIPSRSPHPPEPSHDHADHLRPQWDDPEGVWCDDGLLYVELYCEYTTEYHHGNERVGPFTEHCGHTETVVYEPVSDLNAAPICPAMIFEFLGQRGCPSQSPTTASSDEHDDPAKVVYDGEDRAVYSWSEGTEITDGWIRCEPEVEGVSNYGPEFAEQSDCSAQSPTTTSSDEFPDEVTVDGTCHHCGHDVSVTFTQR